MLPNSKLVCYKLYNNSLQLHKRCAIIILLNEDHQVPFDIDLEQRNNKNKEKDFESLCPQRDASFIDLPINFLISDSSNFSKWPTITQNIHKFLCMYIFRRYTRNIYNASTAQLIFLQFRKSQNVICLLLK